MTLIEKACKRLAEDELALGFWRADREASMRGNKRMIKKVKGDFYRGFRCWRCRTVRTAPQGDVVDLTPKLYSAKFLYSRH